MLLLRLQVLRAKTCAKGKILRAAFKRCSKRSVTTGRCVRFSNVPATCVKDTGKPGKGPLILPKPRKGGLFGWKKTDSDAKRRAALRRGVRADTCPTIIRRLVLLRNITADAATKRLAKRDEAWLEKQPFCKLKKKEGRR